MPFLKELDLYKNSLSSIHEKAFKGLGNLVKLDVAMNNLTQTIALKQLPRLKELNISFNKINLNDENLFKNGFSNEIIRLNLRFNYFSHMQASMFNELSKLEDLNLSFCRIESIDQYAFEGLSSLSK